MTAPAATRRSGPAYRPMPADFPELARKMADNRLREHYRAGQLTVMRWRRQSGVRHVPEGAPLNARVPADFAEVAQGKTVIAVSRHYNRDTRTIRRWFVYTGLTPRPESETRIVITKPVIRAELDPSVPSQAAQHLRRFYANVFRADIRLDERTRQTWGTAHGVPDNGRGHHFVSGLGVLPDYEMIALARDHGFREWNA